MMNTDLCQTEIKGYTDSTAKVSESMTMAVTSQEYIDLLVSDLVQNETLCEDNIVTTLITLQEQVDRLIVDLLKNAV